MATPNVRGADADEGSEKGFSPHEPYTDHNIVDWDSPDSPENPLNWSSSKKNVHLVIVSLFTLIA